MMEASSKLESVAEYIARGSGLSDIEYVGAGSYKQTYHARTSEGHSQALKVFRGTSSLDRISREIDAMSRCSHPNIATLYDVGSVRFEGSEFPYILEEYLGGGPLLGRREQTDTQETIRIGNALIQAVAHISNLDLVHRDIKPDNVLFRSDKVSPVLVDFGLVRDMADVSLTPTWVAMGPGTPLYSAPEQLRNEKGLIDWRTDQFALGVTLSFLRFGYHPFGNITDNHTIIVSTVANRSSCSARFREDATREGLEVLIPMVSPMPIGRLRTPSDLLHAWNEQGSVSK